MERLAPSDPTEVGGVRLHARLGSGGFGHVFLGRNRLGDWVAVKVLQSGALSTEGLQRFSREARMMARAGSPFVAAIQEFGISQDPPYFVAEYIPGPTLLQAVERPGALTQEEIEAIAVGLAVALDGLSSLGVAHRDLKPANVILGVEGPVLVDLGIAKSDAETALTLGSGVAGTPAWMSPEQAAGGSVTPASDVWAWGSLLVWVSRQAGSDALSSELGALIPRTLELEPSVRPTAKQILDALAPEGAKPFISERWKRLSGYAVGQRDAVLSVMGQAPTAVDAGQRSEAPQETRVGLPSSYEHAPLPMVVQSSPSRSQAGIVVAIVVVGVLLVAGIGAAAYLLRPTSIAAGGASPGPATTVVIAPQPPEPDQVTATATELRTVTASPTVQPPSAQSVESLLCNTPVSSMPDLVDTGADSTWTEVVQTMSTWWGFNPGPIDGQYGPRTIAAVKSLQSAIGVVPDGQVGPATWSALQRVQCSSWNQRD